MTPPPVVLREPHEVRKFVQGLRAKGETVVFVPTMGSLHDGHLSLVRAGGVLGPVVVSIFVNPTQFAPGEDFESYPRDLAADIDRMAGLPVAAVFAPDQSVLYPEEADTWVNVGRLSGPLCGTHRPGHFQGVTTVVAKLFGIVQPDVAVFGQKDAQQCLVLHRMTRDLSLPIELVFAPTVRERSGLAMSSRNRYLSSADEERALRVSRALKAGHECLREGERRRETVEARMLEVLGDLPVDYAELRTVPDLERPSTVEPGRVLLAVAAHVDSARLIDNVCLNVSERGAEESPLLDHATLEAVAARVGASRSARRVSMPDVFSVVLAAGKGTRMKSDLAKVLHPLAGRPMIQHVLDALRRIETNCTVVIVGHQADAVREACEPYGVETAVQEPQLGTGHAVQQAEPALAGREGATLVVCGDVPLLSDKTMRQLVKSFEAGAAGVVLTAVLDDPGGYGRIVRDGDDHVTAIVEHKDATDEQRAIREINTGTYCFDNTLLWDALRQVDSDNAQQEFYLTDVVDILVRAGRVVSAVIAEDAREIQGINSVEDLARAERDRKAL